MPLHKTANETKAEYIKNVYVNPMKHLSSIMTRFGFCIIIIRKISGYLNIDKQTT